MKQAMSTLLSQAAGRGSPKLVIVWQHNVHVGAFLIELPLETHGLICNLLGSTCIWGCCSIWEPWGLSNLLTMDNKTNNAKWVGYG